MALTLLYGAINLLYLRNDQLTKHVEIYKEVTYSFIIEGKRDFKHKNFSLQDLNGKKVTEMTLISVDVDPITSSTGENYSSFKMTLSVNLSVKEIRFNLIYLSEITDIIIETFSLKKEDSKYLIRLYKNEDDYNNLIISETSLTFQRHHTQSESNTVITKDNGNSYDQNVEFLTGLVSDKASSDEIRECHSPSTENNIYEVLDNDSDRITTRDGFKEMMSSENDISISNEEVDEYLQASALNYSQEKTISEIEELYEINPGELQSSPNDTKCNELNTRFSQDNKKSLECGHNHPVDKLRARENESNLIENYSSINDNFGNLEDKPADIDQGLFRYRVNKYKCITSFESRKPSFSSDDILDDQETTNVQDLDVLCLGSSCIICLFAMVFGVFLLCFIVSFFSNIFY